MSIGCGAHWRSSRCNCAAASASTTSSADQSSTQGSGSCSVTERRRDTASTSSTAGLTQPMSPLTPLVSGRSSAVASATRRGNEYHCGDERLKRWVYSIDNCSNFCCWPVGAVQVEQHQPGLDMAGTRGVRPHQHRQRLLALVEIGVGKGDDGLVQLGVVHHLAHLDGQAAIGVEGAVGPRAAAGRWVGLGRSAACRRCPGADDAWRRRACRRATGTAGRPPAAQRRLQAVQRRQAVQRWVARPWRERRSHRPAVVERHRLGGGAVEVGRLLRRGGGNAAAEAAGASACRAAPARRPSAARSRRSWPSRPCRRAPRCFPTAGPRSRRPWMTHPARPAARVTGLLGAACAGCPAHACARSHCGACARPWP